MHKIIPKITPKINGKPPKSKPLDFVSGYLLPYALVSLKYFIYYSLLILRYPIVENAINMVKYKCFNNEYSIISALVIL